MTERKSRLRDAKVFCSRLLGEFFGEQSYGVGFMGMRGCWVGGLFCDILWFLRRLLLEMVEDECLNAMF